MPRAQGRTADVRRRCVEPVGGGSCGREFRPPVRDLEQVRCAEHREAPAPVVLPDEVRVVDVVRAELERCGSTRTVAGVIALRLALTLDDPELTPAQVSTISAQLERTMAPILAAGPRLPDEGDTFAERLERKRAALEAAAS